VKRPVMANLRLTLAFIASCALGVGWGTPGLASDLSIAATSVTKQARPPAKNINNKAVKAENAPRPRKTRPRKNVTYNLFNDPEFKLRGADKRHFGISPHINGLGTGLGYSIEGRPVSKTLDSPLLASAFKPEMANSADSTFNCREKSVNMDLAQRELTACYRLELDKSWKAQPYVSRQRSDSGQTWGGGISFNYTY
jgi:hypothetical protein